MSSLRRVKSMRFPIIDEESCPIDRVNGLCVCVCVYQVAYTLIHFREEQKPAPDINVFFLSLMFFFSVAISDFDNYRKVS